MRLTSTRPDPVGSTDVEGLPVLGEQIERVGRCDGDDRVGRALKLLAVEGHEHGIRGAGERDGRAFALPRSFNLRAERI